MFLTTMETPTALLDVREMNELILQVANETGTQPFYGSQHLHFLFTTSLIESRLKTR